MAYRVPMRLLLLALLAATLLAQSNPRYIPFSPSDTKGALYAPDSGPAPSIGVVVIHRTANFMETLACTELSQRGFLGIQIPLVRKLFGHFVFELRPHGSGV